MLGGVAESSIARLERRIVVMKKPMNTDEFFDKINGLLEEKNVLPDILDYGLATHSPVQMVTYEFDLRNNLFYGGNEGIYLDLWIEFYLDGKKEQHGLGTYKTLSEDDEGMRIMAKLLADFITTEYQNCSHKLQTRKNTVIILH